MRPNNKMFDELINKPNTHSTENVLLAAYIRYRGIKQSYVHKIKKGKGIFFFEMPQEEWDNLVNDYDSSAELRFEHCRVDTINLTFV